MARRIISSYDVAEWNRKNPPVGGAAAPGGQAGPEKEQKPDDYFSRISKYIPAEVLSIYMTFSVLFKPDVAAQALPTDRTRMQVLFWVCLLITPTYLYFVTKREDINAPGTRDGRPAWTQLILATVAFTLWALATTEPFAALEGIDSSLFALGIAVSTLFFGVIDPKS